MPAAQAIKSAISACRMTGHREPWSEKCSEGPPATRTTASRARGDCSSISFRNGSGYTSTCLTGTLEHNSAGRAAHPPPAGGGRGGFTAVVSTPNPPVHVAMSL